MEKANAQLDHLVGVLEARGVIVDRPTSLQWNQAVQTPDFMTGSMFGCMPPRDVPLTVGKEILSAPMSFRCRFWEYLAYHRLMQRYIDEDPGFRCEQAPRPRLTVESFQQGYFDKVTIEERLARTAALNFVTHIDATFVTLCPGLVTNNPNRKLPDEQRKIFEANDWQIIYAASPAHNTPPLLCYSSVWLSMNVLTLDHNTVNVEGSVVFQQEQLDKLGFEVVPVPFRDACPFGGGLHCATGDVRREGSCEDYFPK